MNKIISKFLQIGIPLGFGIFLIWFTYNKFTPEQFVELKAYFSNANYGIVVLSVLLSVLSHFLRAYRWNFMLQPLGYKPKLANNFMAISIAYGIAIATVLTLVMLPLLLSFSNALKVKIKWLITDRNITKEEVERAIIESNFDKDEI